MVRPCKSRASERCFRFIGAMGIVLTVGCATQLNVLREEPLDSGASVTFEATVDEAVAAARKALVDSGFEILEPVEQQGSFTLIYSELGYSMQSNGQFLRLAISDTLDGVTVALVNVRRFPGNVTENLSIPRVKIFRSIRLQLEARGDSEEDVF